MSSIETQAYHFTEEIVKLLLEKFDGKEVGSEEMTLEVVMAELSPDFKPGDKVKKKKKKKSEVDEDGNPFRRRRSPQRYIFYEDKITSYIAFVDAGAVMLPYVKMQTSLGGTK